MDSFFIIPSSQTTWLKGDQGATRVGKGGQLSFRKALYELLRFWSCEGFSCEENYASNVKTGIAAVLGRYKQSYEEGALEPVRSELAQAGQYLDHAARTGMAALLAGPVFDADARRPQGPVLQWIERLLTHRSHTGSTSMSLPQNQGAGAGWSALATTSTGNASSNTAGKVAGPERQEVARMALHNLLHANLDMFATCLDKCYDANRVVASSFFQVICEVYATQSSVHIAPHVMLSLILYKMVDEARDVREDSLHMLHVLSQREWGVSSGKASGQTASLVSDAEGGVAGTGEEDQPGRGSDDESASESELGGTGGDAVVVLGNLQDSYQQFQYQLSCKLARDHLELSEALCEEMMTRALECWDSTIQHPVLICLAPWMENLIISSHWKGSWCERLLKSMYYVTQRHGPAFPFEIERLWSTLAASKRNIIPILDFLTSLGVYAALQESASLTEYFAVAKRIALYLARISPQHTIDHLAYEISLQAFEDDGSVAAAPGAPMPLSFSDITGPENIAGSEGIAQEWAPLLLPFSGFTLKPSGGRWISRVGHENAVTVRFLAGKCNTRAAYTWSWITFRMNALKKAECAQCR
ncbi:cell morphogenesis central region-domain-containing protein [Dunaliella salina]|uniref:Cell morphogenesis central region-domain-containing protein n=1 Tax=Dunaliella salina TaxID=3046 RepID=A0ABQ7GJ29_DUNSA|nr:cell morphogenesis central region-domain-containing protein [Dunaliella salina]|eukprot:KAF5834594.1 cell morphogenesis central region-domain-containing protein [Dunaliella salina]